MPHSGPNSRRPRLVDVAREANVSVQAASHVMSGNTSVRIPEATRMRIREAARKVGYVPNRLAQAMKTGKSNVIGLWIPLDRPTKTYFLMLERLSAKAQESGYSLMIIGLNRDLAYQGIGPLPEFWPVDGIIAIDAGKAIGTFRRDPRNDATPVAILALEQFANTDTIGWDVYAGARDAVKVALAAGKKDVVHISPEWILASYPREQRRRGYTDAMAEYGLEPVIISSKQESSENAESAMLEYLENHPVPQAVFGFLDNLAIGAARAIFSKGAKIPEDCWIIGVGDTPEAKDFRVPISSLSVPVDAIIDQAWNWLLSRIPDITQESRMTVLPMEFIQRDSTRLP